MIESAHTTACGLRGLGQLAPDESCIPLCHQDHQDGAESYHKLGERRWLEVHGIALLSLVEQLHHCYLLSHPNARMFRAVRPTQF